jgi:hypothetical protein
MKTNKIKLGICKDTGEDVYQLELYGKEFIGTKAEIQAQIEQTLISKSNSLPDKSAPLIGDSDFERYWGYYNNK